MGDIGRTPPESVSTGRSVWRRVAQVALGLAAVLVLAAVINLWLFLRSDLGQQMVGIFSGIGSLTYTAAQAPGADALRAAGCTEALVFPMSQIRESMEKFAASHSGFTTSATGNDDTVVFCQVESEAGPDCPTVARVYAGAAPGAPERLAVMVTDATQSELKCEGSYARDGSFLGHLQPSEPRS